MSRRPPLAVTMGEPAGIGPEITVAAHARLTARAEAAFYVIGAPEAYAAAARQAGGGIVEISAPEEAGAAFTRGLPVAPIKVAAAVEPRRLDPQNAAAVIASIDQAAADVAAGRAAAMITNPIHKHALFEGAGFAHPGHTEYLAHLAGAPRTVMLLAAEELRVAPVTIHCALADVPKRLTRQALEETLRILDAGLRQDFGVTAPRIAVAGLNPHAGESGAFGREEIDVIAPTLEALRAEGFDLVGPKSADTLFHTAARARYDAAACMYHDQALIPIKTLAFDRGVNVTLGLPFIRTSPDHGPALDIAGQGAATPRSLIEAILLARRMADARARAA